MQLRKGESTGTLDSSPTAVVKKVGASESQRQPSIFELNLNLIFKNFGFGKKFQKLSLKCTFVIVRTYVACCGFPLENKLGLLTREDTNLILAKEKILGDQN